MQCLSVRGRDELAWYRSTLHGDAEAWGHACADWPDPHAAVGAAAFLAGAIRSYLSKRDFPRRIAVDFDAAGFVVERWNEPAGKPVGTEREPSPDG
jgi:hypothetical protein